MTLEEVEETLTRFQSKPGVLGTLVVTGVVAYLVLVIPCASDSLPSLGNYVLFTNILPTAEGEVLKTSLAPQMLDKVHRR